MLLDDELRQIFLGEVTAYLTVLGDESAPTDDQAVAAHGLKGAAGMLGFAELQTLAAALEHSLREGDTGPRTHHLPRIRDIIGQITRGEDPDATPPQTATAAPREGSEAAAASPAPAQAGFAGGFDEETAKMLRSFFVEEAHDHLQAMESALDQLAVDPDAVDAVETLHRASHTLKGAAATVELPDISRAAHLLESRLEPLRDSTAVPAPTELPRLRSCLEVLRAIVGSPATGSGAAPDRLPELEQLLAAPFDARPAPDDAPLPAPPIRAGAPRPPDPSAAAVDDAASWDDETRAILLETFSDEAEELLDTLDPLLEELIAGDTTAELIDHLFRLAHTLKGSAGAVGLRQMSRAAHRLEDHLEELRNGRLREARPELIDVVSALRELATEAGDSDRGEVLVGQVEAYLADDEPDADRPATPPGVVVLATADIPPASTDVSVERRAVSERRRGERRHEDERLIRVNAERLDGLLGSIGELVFRRTLIERRSEELTGLVRDLGASHQSLRAAIVELRNLRGVDSHVQRFTELEIEFSDVHSNLDRAEGGLREETEGLRRDAQLLQEGLTQIRLLSVRYLFARLRRSVRDIARSEGKQVVLHTQGEDTEIDKLVAEKIADPMIQIIRNAVAHGVESPERRRDAGKPEAGTITITANQEGNFVILEVRDDGQGIDLDTIREALVEKGLMSKEEAAIAPEAEVTAAIFLPGLSTRRAADAVAGRGVGLDLARDTIGKLGGEVTVHSKRGEGTRFAVRMPLSTAVTNALLFKCANEVFCIPVRWVVETRSVRTSDVVRHRGRDAIPHRDQIIPMLRLADVLGTDEQILGKFIPTIILRHLDYDFALAVDKLIGPREIVLRKLGPLLEPLDIYSAATISGAGKVQLVLDVPMLQEWASAWRTLPRAAQRFLPDAPRRILVCDDSRSIREVVSRILQAEGYGVELAHDGWDAWERMAGRPVDLLLTDLEMPRMDGYALIEKVRKAPDYERLPILVLSSRTGEENQRRAKRAGADGFLYKPVNRRVIIARIQELLGN
ncbi:MAG: Hpt domain-containing protein [bacterium]